jgi:hypothetical protein
MLIPAANPSSKSLRRTFVASTLCATKQLNKIPPSAEHFNYIPFFNDALLSFRCCT